MRRTTPPIFIVDDDPAIRETIGSVLEASGWQVAKFASCEMFLLSLRPGQTGSLLVDAQLPGMGAPALLR